ncbi:MAG: hypothetical protein ACRDQU_03490 [Pseudonocardiaceae bacterium]
MLRSAVTNPAAAQKSATAGDATSQRIEQQADFLSGVWAHAMALDGKLDAARFKRSPPS